jgi:hypothetical protein
MGAMHNTTKLEQIADGVWGHERAIKLPGGMLLPSRATIVRVRDGSLAIHSPLAIDDDAAKSIDALGDVRAIVAPSCVHWMFVAGAKKRYPKARLYGPPGLEKKLKGIPFDRLPEEGNIKGLGDEIVVKRIQGVPYMTEHSFLHEPSRSLIVTDLMFNVHDCQGFMMKLFFKMVGTWGKTAQSRFWRFLVRDRAAAAKSALEVLAWDFERIVVAHGEVVDCDARERARDALAWMTHTPKMLGSGSAIA